MAATLDAARSAGTAAWRGGDVIRGPIRRRPLSGEWLHVAVLDRNWPALGTYLGVCQAFDDYLLAIAEKPQQHEKHVDKVEIQSQRPMDRLLGLGFTIVTLPICGLDRLRIVSG